MTAAVVWLVAGWGSLAIVVAGRNRRRVVALNECLHELRRPLQALRLERPAGRGRIDSIQLAVAALDDLDRLVNRREDDPGMLRRPGRADVRDLVRAAAIRWRLPAARSGRLIRIRCGAIAEPVSLDAVEASRALDNLIANALEHGRGPIVLEASIRDRRLEIAVRDGGARVVARPRAASDPRHGHGLDITRDLASRSGGELQIRRGAGQTTASLSFPLAGLRAPVAAGSRPRLRPEQRR